MLRTGVVVFVGPEFTVSSEMHQELIKVEMAVRWNVSYSTETIRQLSDGILALTEWENIIQDVKVPTAAPGMA
jgi:hypothetical protein